MTQSIAWMRGEFNRQGIAVIGFTSKGKLVTLMLNDRLFSVKRALERIASQRTR